MREGSWPRAQISPGREGKQAGSRGQPGRSLRVSSLWDRTGAATSLLGAETSFLSGRWAGGHERGLLAGTHHGRGLWEPRGDWGGGRRAPDVLHVAWPWVLAEECLCREVQPEGSRPPRSRTLLRPTDILAMPASVSPLGGAASYG